MPKCLLCKKETANPKFCCQSHAATFNNTGRRRHGKKPASCLSCNKVTASWKRKFCSNRCQHDYGWHNKISKWLATAKASSGQAKQMLVKLYGYTCAECRIDNWNGKTIVLELEHKDGNSTNNKESNVCLLCPNCHSQTPTYKNKNKGNGRHQRRQRYQQGLSY